MAKPNIFAEVSISEHFNHQGDLYKKVSYDSAIPITFRAGEIPFNGNDEVCDNIPVYIEDI